MSHYHPTPNAAERYFDGSIFGQMYTLIADILGRPAGAPSAATARPEREHAAPTKPVRKLVERVDRWFWRQEQKARDDYLAASADVFELERRIEALYRR